MGEWASEEAYTEAGGHLPRLLKVEDVSEFDDDWSQGPSQSMTMVFDEFMVDGDRMDDSIFSAPCHPTGPAVQTKNLRASSMPKKAKKAIKNAHAAINWFGAAEEELKTQRSLLHRQGLLCLLHRQGLIT